MSEQKVRIDMAGRVFGELIGLRFSHTDAKKNAHWYFRCSCGVEKAACGADVRAGKIKSCGHLQLAALNTRTHGHATRDKKTPTYVCWRNMLARCYDTKRAAYANYGGRGIVVCDRWRNSYAAFLEDMGEKPAGLTIERDNVNRGYEPGNCRWATDAEQAQNRRVNIANWPMVVEMRGRRAGGAQYKELSRDYGMSVCQVARICRGESWVVP